MAKRNIIVLGDWTTHGGTVISAWGQDGDVPKTINGKPVVCVGDKVTCPKCRGTHTILEGAENPPMYLNGRQVALEGCRVSDNSQLLSAGQDIAWHTSEGEGAEEVSGAQTGTTAKGIQTADAMAGISAEEARLLKEQQKEGNEEKKGYVTIFINNNGIGHASLFVGREEDKDWLLFDPCGSYSKGRGYWFGDKSVQIRTRASDVMEKGYFSARDYYLYHIPDGSKINAYSFEIMESEEQQIRDNIDKYVDTSCFIKCSSYVSAVLFGVETFKSLDSDYSTPWGLQSAIKQLTKLPISTAKEDIINRMSGKRK